jgi:hypothetical protein
MKRLALSLTLIVGITAACRAETVDVKYRGSVDLNRFACTSIERSSFIKRVCYDRTNSYMVVSLNGTYYDYCNIDSATVGSFLAADSMGRFFNASIKGHFDCRAAANVPTLQMAAAEQDRFVEIPGDNDTMTFDLNTVYIIQPGKFMVTGTTIDNPDVMNLELKALATLQTYCARTDGTYPAAADLLTLGPPDMPVKNIEVESHATSETRTVTWYYPYKKLASKEKGELQERWTLVHCESAKVSAANVINKNREARLLITNGSSTKYIFDCKRELMGFLFSGENDPAKVQMFPVRGGLDFWYVAVCLKVTHETPYPYDVH